MSNAERAKELLEQIERDRASFTCAQADRIGKNARELAALASGPTNAEALTHCPHCSGRISYPPVADKPTEAQQAAAAMCGSEGVKQDSCGGSGGGSYEPQSIKITTNCRIVANDSSQDSSSIAPAPEAVESAEPTVMNLCEINHLILHPDQLYRFRKAPGCKACEDYLNPPEAVDWKALAVEASKAIRTTVVATGDDGHVCLCNLKGHLKEIAARIEQAEKRKDGGK